LTFGRVTEARLLILDGDLEQGLALLDEVGVGDGRRGSRSSLSTGVVYCELVCVLQGLAQYDAAEEEDRGDGALVSLDGHGMAGGFAACW
jgi:hypothetical protein